MVYLIYQIVARLCFLLAFPFLFIYSRSGPEPELRQRLGFYPEMPARTKGRPRLWLHAASVGEMGVALALVRAIWALRPEAELVVSVLTRAGWRYGREQLPPEVMVVFAPLDLGGICRRAFNQLRPDLYLCLETELWPAILRQAARCGAGPVLLNGRISARSSRRYRLTGGLIRESIAGFAALAVNTENDARRFLALGARPERLTVTGNAKHDLLPDPAADQGRTTARYRERLNLRPGQPLWVAGSTRSGEEEIILAAFQGLRQSLPDLVLAVAPRHLRRLAEVERILSPAGFQRLSELPARPRCQAVVLVDSMGELANLYAAADYVFCGGSLVKKGGHNLLEPAAWGKPVLYGPFMEDFGAARDLLAAAGGGFTVHDAGELAERILWLACHPEAYQAAAKAAAQAAAGGRGAAARQAQIVQQLLTNKEPSA